MKVRLAAVLGALGALGLSVALGSGHTAYAQRRGGERRGRVPEPNALLASVTSLKCSFPASAAATWEAGQPKVQAPKPSDLFTLTITEIDTQEGTALVVGLGAPTHVTVKLAGSNLHFLDIRPSGALAITTVFSQESRDRRLKAIHSRSDYQGSVIPGLAVQPDVSQYYGDCEIGPR